MILLNIEEAEKFTNFSETSKDSLENKVCLVIESDHGVGYLMGLFGKYLEEKTDYHLIELESGYNLERYHFGSSESNAYFAYCREINISESSSPRLLNNRKCSKIRLYNENPLKKNKNILLNFQTYIQKHLVKFDKKERKESFMQAFE